MICYDHNFGKGTGLTWMKKGMLNCKTEKLKKKLIFNAIFDV